MNAPSTRDRPLILTGIDFSDTSGYALRHAHELAGRLGTGVEVVHVREGFRQRPWSPSPEEELWLDAAGLTVETIGLREGTPWVELVRAATEREAELIVVGTHGRTGFQPVQLGSTASRLALLSPRPVLLVGGRERVSPARGELRLVGARP